MSQTVACSDEVLAQFAQKLKVCGHPVRLKLLCHIAREQDLCVSELWTCVQQPQPVVSQHLAVLKEKGIVRSEVKGNKRIYSIVDPFVREMVDAVESGHAVSANQSAAAGN
ncbi:MAG: ArsR/SmtB family transcription factor [Spirochaetaceae bacterium]